MRRRQLEAVAGAPSGASAFGRTVFGTVLVAVGLTGVAGPVAAQDSPVATQMQVQELEQRLQRVERVLDSRAMTELLSGVDAATRELRELRGEVDVLRYELERLNERQRDQFRHLDERVAAIEAGGPPGAAQAGERVVPMDLPASGEQDAYQEAFDELMEGRYGPAIQRFEAFIDGHPDSAFLPNAWYWLGEARYASGDYADALADFTRLREEFPDSDKSGDALLKIGFSHYELGNVDEARAALETVRSDYSGTALERLAEERLARIDAQ